MSKKISVSALEKAAAANSFDKTVSCEWGGIQIEVKKILSLEEMLAFIDNVTAACFSDDGTVYAPEMTDFALKVAIVELYTNITLPKDIRKKYDILYNTNLVSAIVACVNKDQIDSIVTAIDARISHAADANVEAINRQAKLIMDSFDALQKKLDKLFDGVETGDIKNITEAISNGRFDEEKMISLLMKQKNGG